MSEKIIFEEKWTKRMYSHFSRKICILKKGKEKQNSAILYLPSTKYKSCDDHV